MPISGNSSYVPTLDVFIPHFANASAAVAPAVLLIHMPDNTTVSLAQLTALRNEVEVKQTAVQARLVDQLIARGDIDLRKAALLAQFNTFIDFMAGYYTETSFWRARPLAPGIGEGQENFTRPLVDAMTLWDKMNDGPAPSGLTLPLVLPDELTQGAFASFISGLQFAYAEEKKAAQAVALARAERDLKQERAYEAMKSYRAMVPGRLQQFPAIVATLPRLTPEPGHTPVPVNASAIFVAPDSSKVVYEASEDLDLAVYQLRGTVGDDYDENDAVVIATNGPGAPREFVTDFGLTQPGAKIALKVFVVLTTENESGSATLFVQRPAAVVPMAA